MNKITTDRKYELVDEVPKEYVNVRLRQGWDLLGVYVALNRIADTEPPKFDERAVYVVAKPYYSTGCGY